MSDALRLWDHTALDVLERCPQEFVQRFVHHRESPVPDPSRLFGQAVHAGVAALYDGAPVSVAQEMALAAWGGPGRGALAAFDGAGAEASRKPHFTSDYVEQLVALYAQQYPPASRGRLLLNESYLEWPDERICGIVDRVVQRPLDVAPIVRDLKTTGLYVGEKWAQQWANHLQTGSFYLDLAEHALQHQARHAAAGVGERGDVAADRRLGGGALPEPRRRRGDGEPLDDAPAARGVASVVLDTVWIDAIHVDRRGVPRPDDFHVFGPFRYSPARREELRRVRWALVEQADALAQAPELAEQRTRSCFRYNQLCAFFRFCVTDPGAARDGAYQLAEASGELERREWTPALRDR